MLKGTPVSEESEIPFVEVGQEGMLKPNEVAQVEISGAQVLLCNSEGEYYAIQNLCTHDDAPLGQGRLIGCEIECARHGAKFDVTDGSAAGLPAFRPIATFPVRITDGKIEVQYKKPEPPKFEDPRIGFQPFPSA